MIVNKHFYLLYKNLLASYIKKNVQSVIDFKFFNSDRGSNLKLLFFSKLCLTMISDLTLARLLMIILIAYYYK